MISTAMPVFAEENAKTIETLTEFKSSLKVDLSSAEKNALIANADGEIVAEFMKEKIDKAVQFINGRNIDANMQAMPNGSAYGVQTFDLGDGCVLIMELIDTSEDSASEQTSLNAATVSTGSDQWKDFGSRSFTAKASVRFGGVNAYMTLTNYYELSANGIDETPPGKASCSWQLSTGQITHGIPQVTDGAARTPGASDVNMECMYSLVGDESSGRINRAKYSLKTTIGYVAINKTTKRIKVRESWSLTKV